MSRRILIACVMALSLAVGLVYYAFLEPRAVVVIENRTDRPISGVEVVSLEGRRTFLGIGPGESRGFRIAQASTADLKFRCDQGGAVRRLGFGVGMPPGEYVVDVVFRVDPGGLGSDYHTGTDIRTKIRIFFRDMWSRLGW